MADTQHPESGDRRQQIMEAALRVFSTKGFQKATNKDIAEAAGGISPGLIYHYFKDKQDLFFSIIQDRAPMVSLAMHPEQLMELPPREGLALIGRSYLSAAGSPGNAAVLRMLVSEAIRFPQISEMMYQTLVSRIFNLIKRYLEHQVELGRLRPHDSLIATRSFVGMFLAHIFVREIFRQPEAQATSDEEVVRNAVEIFLHGLEAEGSGAEG
ncbi:MAG: TetR/AcrR family transcriptional regulator [Chloroflexota bacterium]|nr:MAG: TetR/AcrR family transcriptional regulator [Chloroflexota bacterium]